MENMIVKEKMSLSDILTTFNQLDEGLIDISKEEMEELGRKIHIKVDGYKDFLDRCDTEIQHFKTKAQQYAKTAKSIENTRNNVENLMLFHMEQNKIEKLAGDNFIVKLTKRIKSKLEQLTPSEPSPEQFFKMKEYVSTKYNWNNAVIKEELKKEKPNPILKDLFRLNDTTSLRWTINKGI